MGFGTEGWGLGVWCWVLQFPVLSILCRVYLSKVGYSQGPSLFLVSGFWFRISHFRIQGLGFEFKVCAGFTIHLSEEGMDKSREDLRFRGCDSISNQLCFIKEVQGNLPHMTIFISNK